MMSVSEQNYHENKKYLLMLLLKSEDFPLNKLCSTLSP
jgi:hypothetical protein